MTEPTCCGTPRWKEDDDLGSAGGFEFLLGRCENCGTPWMNVFCVATGITGYEPVSSTDAERMRAIATAAELKAFMRAWGEKHL